MDMKIEATQKMRQKCDTFPKGKNITYTQHYLHIDFMLSLEIFEKMSKNYFSGLVGFDYDHMRTGMSRPSCTWQFYVSLLGTSIPGDVAVLMHSTTSTCPQVGAKCYPHFVDN
jgi:hypothetical protein